MKRSMSPLQRLARMRLSFAKNKSILAEDYEYFTKPHAPIPPNKVARKSVAQSERQSRVRNEMRSSDRTDD